MKANSICVPLVPMLLVLAGLLACNLSPAATPVPGPTPVDLASLPSVESMGRLSLMEGWVQTGGRLLWTGDAGGTWLDITPPGLPACLGEIGCPSSVDVPFFLDAAHVWLPVLQGQEGAPPTTLSAFYTGNGGGDWATFTVAEFAEPLSCPGPACLSSVGLDFVDPLNGWLAAYAPMGNISDRQYLYRTGDGGQSWVPLSIPLSGRIAFLDAATGWAAGGATRWSSEQLLRTQDGGGSWQAVSLVFPEPYNESLSAEYSWYQEPVFFTGGSGVLPVRFDQPQGAGKAIGFYTTEDGGGSWSLATTLQDQEMQRVGELFPIPWSAIDETTWYVSINEARQYLTRDRGQTWEAFPAAGLGGVTLLDVRFVTEVEGWGLGLICGFESGCLQPMFATHDGGRSWSPMAPAPAPPTDTPRPATIATNTPLAYVDCAWSWANRPLPELTDQLQAALDAAGIPGATARAYDFGENCNNQETGTVRFARIETDVEIRLEVADAQDLDALGSLTDQVVAVLDTFVRDSLSGRLPGRIGLNFTLRGGAGHWLYFYDEQLEEARGRGLSGRALLEALGYLP